MTMSDEEINVRELLEEFGDFSITELMLEISDLRAQCENEKKAHNACLNAKQRLTEENEALQAKINTAINVLKGIKEEED